MRKLKKLLVAIIASCLLLLPTASLANAQDLVDPDNIKATLQMFGIDLDDPESIQKAIDQLKNGGLTGLIGLLGFDIGALIDELQEYLFAFEMETTKKEEPETTTEAPTTEAPTTEPPTYNQPSYEYTPPTQSPVVTPTQEPTTYEYISPEVIYTEPYTTTAFNPVINDNLSIDNSPSNPIKTAIGIILLLGSGIGVIVVILALKRNRI